MHRSETSGRDNFFRAKIKRDWKKYLVAHPGDVGSYPGWLKEQLVMSLKRVDSLTNSVREMKGVPRRG